MQIFHYYIDQSKAWLEVADAVLGPLAIADQISGHSKHLGGRFYLDSHHDIRLFLDAYRARYGEPEIVHHSETGESVIRMYPDYRPDRLHPRIKRLLRLSRVA